MAETTPVSGDPIPAVNGVMTDILQVFKTNPEESFENKEKKARGMINAAMPAMATIYVAAAMDANIQAADLLLDTESIAEADPKHSLTSAIARQIIRQIVRAKPDGTVEIKLGGLLRSLVESTETCAKDPKLLALPSASEVDGVILRNYLVQQLGADSNFTNRVQAESEMKRMVLAFTSGERVTPSNGASKTELNFLAHVSTFRAMCRTWLTMNTTKEARIANPYVPVETHFDVVTVPMMLLAMALYRPPSPVAVQALTDGGLMPEVESGFAQILAMTTSMVNIARLMTRTAMRGIINIFAVEEKRGFEAVRRDRPHDPAPTAQAEHVPRRQLSTSRPKFDQVDLRGGGLNDKWQLMAKFADVRVSRDMGCTANEAKEQITTALAARWNRAGGTSFIENLVGATPCERNDMLIYFEDEKKRILGQTSSTPSSPRK